MSEVYSRSRLPAADRAGRVLSYARIRRHPHRVPHQSAGQSRSGARSGTTRAEDAQGTPTQSHISPSILVYADYSYGLRFRVKGSGVGV